jgi:hypothetical protein
MSQSAPPYPTFDVRLAANGYASIVGSVGGFVVTAVVLLFTVSPKQIDAHPLEFGFATGLLVLALIGCLTGAFVLAAFSGESELSANLPVATMYAGAAVTLAVVSILAAFEVLASVYLKQSKDLFVVMTGAGSLVGVLFVASALGDGWVPGTTGWLSSQSTAYRVQKRLWVILSLPVIGSSIAFSLGWSAALSKFRVHAVVGVGIGLVVAAVVGALIRSTHDQANRGFTKTEGLGIPLIVASYSSTLMLFLP